MVVVLALTPGCRSAISPRLRPSDPADVQDIRSRSERRFADAIFFKPRESDDLAWAQPLAPLFLHECSTPPADPPSVADRHAPTPAGGEVNASCAPRFGELLLRPRTFGESPSWSVAQDLPIVYVQHDRLTVGRTTYDELIHVWFYPATEPGSPPRPHGLRTILGRDGFPVVWEQLEDAPARRLVFVSQSFERAAQRAFGPPLPGRRFACEADRRTAPQILVVDLVEDGPIPMGPYLYVDAKLRLQSVLCRCSPSRVDRIRESVFYELRSLDELRALGYRPDFQPLNPARDLRLPPGV